MTTEPDNRRPEQSDPSAGDRHAPFEGEAELHALMDALATDERAAAGVSLESRVFAASIDAMAERVPADVRALARAMDELAGEPVPAGLADRVMEASLAALTVPTAGAGGSVGSVDSAGTGAARGRESRWSIWTWLGGTSLALRAAAAVVFVGGAAALYVSVNDAQSNSSGSDGSGGSAGSGNAGTVVSGAGSGGSAMDAAALASQVDRSIDALWDELEVASENDWSESYDLNAMEQELLTREDAS